MRVLVAKKANCLCATILVVLGAAINVHSQPRVTPTTYRLSVPDKQWALELVLPTIDISYVRPSSSLPPSSFVSAGDTLTKNREALLFATQLRKNREAPAHLIVKLMPAANGLTADVLRTLALKKLAKEARNIKTSQHDHIPVATYSTDNQPLKTMVGTAVVENFLGPRVTRHLEAYFVKNDVCATVTMAAASFESEDEKQFYSLLDSVSFVDISRPSNSLDYYHVGRLQHMQQAYARALEAFETAFRLEKRQRELDPKSFRNLVASGADAAMAIGRPATAAEFLEHGVNSEPTNAMLLMKLARTYASLRDTEKTLATLKTTFLLMKREKQIFENTKFPGVASHSMSLPDLNRDPAFKQMMKDKAFRDAVKAMRN